jgi:hypothetical protein
MQGALRLPFFFYLKDSHKFHSRDKLQKCIGCANNEAKYGGLSGEN